MGPKQRVPSVEFLKTKAKNNYVGKTPENAQSLPIIGSMYWMYKNRGRMLERGVDNFFKITHSETMTFFISFRQSTTTVDPENIRYMLSENFDNYQRGENVKYYFKDFLGEGMFVSSGSEWRNLRKAARPHFKIRNIHYNSKLLNQYANKFLDLVEKHQGKYLDAQDLFSRYTLDSFGDFAFGVDIQSMKSLDTFRFAEAFVRIQHKILLRFRIPGLAKFHDQVYTDDINYLNNFVYSIIKARKEEPKEELEKREDLLSRFMQGAQEEEGNSDEETNSNYNKQNCTNNNNNENYSDDYLRDAIMNFLLAGR